MPNRVWTSGLNYNIHFSFYSNRNPNVQLDTGQSDHYSDVLKINTDYVHLSLIVDYKNSAFSQV